MNGEERQDDVASPRWLGLRGLVVPAVMAAVALLFTLPIFRDFDLWGIQDWDISAFFHGTASVTVREYGQIPLWNPWYCGGMPLLGRPESPWLSPLFLLTLLLGPLHSLKLQVTLYLWAGLVGMHRLSREQGVSQPGAFLSAFAFMLGGVFNQHMVYGNTHSFQFALIPWAVLYYLRAVGPWRRASAADAVRRADGGQVFPDAAKCALAIVLMWFGGGPYAMVLTLLFIACHAGITLLLRGQSLWRTLRAGLVVGALLLAIGAVKFAPAVEFTMQYPREDNLQTGFSLDSLQRGLFGRDQTAHAAERMPQGTGFLRGVSHGMNETGTYVGLPAFALACLGLGRRRERLVWGLCGALFLWLCFGVRAPVSLWDWLHELPVFSIMRVAERFRVLFVLCLAVLAGFGLDLAMSCVVRTWPAIACIKRGAWVCVALVWIDFMIVVAPLYRQSFVIHPLIIPPAAERAFVQTAMQYPIDKHGWAMDGSDILYCTWSSHFPSLLANQGIVQGYEEIPSPRMAVPIEDLGYRGELFLLGTGGEARYSAWSPNRLTCDLRVEGPGLLVVNQNYFPGWYVDGGAGVVTNVGGLMAVAVDAGDRQVAFYYRPLSYRIGVWVSGLTVAGLGLAWLLKRRAVM